MADVVYALCALTSLVAAVLLARAYARSPARLLLLAAVAFVGLALNNVGLFVDVVILPDVDLTLLRTIPAVLGMLALVAGLAWEEP
jgi:hypothetical protein